MQWGAGRWFSHAARCAQRLNLRIRKRATSTSGYGCVGAFGLNALSVERRAQLTDHFVDHDRRTVRQIQAANGRADRDLQGMVVVLFQE